jgi:hypothetical protein
LSGIAYVRQWALVGAPGRSALPIILFQLDGTSVKVRVYSLKFGGDGTFIINTARLGHFQICLRAQEGNKARKKERKKEGEIGVTYLPVLRFSLPFTHR